VRLLRLPGSPLLLLSSDSLRRRAFLSLSGIMATRLGDTVICWIKMEFGGLGLPNCFASLSLCCSLFILLELLSSRRFRFLFSCDKLVQIEPTLLGPCSDPCQAFWSRLRATLLVYERPFLARPATWYLVLRTLATWLTVLAGAWVFLVSWMLCTLTGKMWVCDGLCRG
jgi:hypothetical protein